MQTLSLVECVELKFSGSVLKNAICFGDCDNDGFSELILGTTNGDLLVYRDDKWVCSASELGTISAVAVGDLLNIHRNVLVVITIEGWCHVFDIQYELNSVEKMPDVDCPPQVSPSDYCVVSPFHSQRIVCNTKVMVLGDVNDDGIIELIVGLTDRVLRTYQWMPEPISDDSKDEKEDDLKSENSEIYDGRLFPMNKWEFANQIGSISLHRNENLVSILVGQPGGTVARITETSSPKVELIDLKQRTNHNSGNSNSSDAQPHSNSNKTSPGSEANATSPDECLRSEGQEHSVLRNPSPVENITIKHHTLEKTHMRNPNISTEVAGNILSSDGKDEDSYSVATQDGTILIARDEKIEWSFQLDHQILSLHQLNGKIVFVGWEGDTYIIDRKNNTHMDSAITRFHFEESVAAFVVGLYAVQEENDQGNLKLTNKYSMAFVTFHEKIYVYPNELLQG